MPSNLAVEKTSVLVVGGGPAGLLASILLSRFDIDHILIERRTGVQPAPAAHVINTRTMEILRSADIDTEKFYALNKHTEAQFVSWVKNPRCKALGKLSFAGDAAHITQRLAASPEHTTNISQNLFETALRDEAVEQTESKIRYGHTWEAFIDGDTHHARVLDENQNAYEIKANYILAADGAASSIARSLGIGKTGPESLATFLNLSCEVDLTDIVKERHSLLYWCLSPQTPGILIVHDPRQLTVYMRPIFEPYETIDDYDDARCEALLGEIFGPDTPVKVTFKGIWKMAAQVADRFSIDNVFLIGDSAHRFPPTGGLGLNSGAGDVHNLVWKLAATLKHQAPADLLASYELERKPVAQLNCDTSANNFRKMTEVTDVLGLDVSHAHIPARFRSSALLRYLPSRMTEALLKLLTWPIVRKVEAAYAETADGQTIRARVQVAIDNQIEHFDMLGAELGYVYRDGCAVDPEARKTRNNSVRDYTPDAAAGARLPHVAFGKDGDTMTTLDVISYDRYTLFTNGPATDIPDRLTTFGLPCHSFDIQKTDSVEALVKSLNLPAGCWILVRPDGHVATRS